MSVLRLVFVLTSRVAQYTISRRRDMLEQLLHVHVESWTAGRAREGLEPPRAVMARMKRLA